MPSSAVAEGLGSVTGLSGRMERIDRGQPFLVIVDFAHTPNALERAIGAARQMLDEQGNGRIITVFGSAGKRDVEKRRLMAEVAARDADLTVLTAEDPRTESLDEILAMMATAAESQGGVEGESFWRDVRPGPGHLRRAGAGPPRRHRPHLRQGARTVDVLRRDGVPLGRPRRNADCAGCAAVWTADDGFGVADLRLFDVAPSFSDRLQNLICANAKINDRYVKR